MAHEPRINLIPGESRWLRYGRAALLVTAFFSLMIAPTALVWKLSMTLSLVAMFSLMHRHLNQLSRFKAITLLDSRFLTLLDQDNKAIPATLGQHPWVSPWLCILPVIPAEDQKSVRLIICRSRNHPQDYRRLLQLMRLGSDAEHQDGILDRG